MDSFRKHALEGTRRPDSFLIRRSHRSGTTPKVAALFVLLLAVAANCTAAAGQQKGEQKARGDEPTAGAIQAPEQKTSGQSKEKEEGARIPIRVKRVETADGPGVLATIGDFPSDLNEAGQDFLKREFFKHFASDVLRVGDSDSHTTLQVAMLPQEKANQREGDFIFGKVSGHMVVLVEKRRVLVACTFSEVENQPRLVAAAVRFIADSLFAG